MVQISRRKEALCAAKSDMHETPPIAIGQIRTSPPSQKRRLLTLTRLALPSEYLRPLQFLQITPKLLQLASRTDDISSSSQVRHCALFASLWLSGAPRSNLRKEERALTPLTLAPSCLARAMAPSSSQTIVSCGVGRLFLGSHASCLINTCLGYGTCWTVLIERFFLSDTRAFPRRFGPQSSAITRQKSK